MNFLVNFFELLLNRLSFDSQFYALPYDINFKILFSLGQSQCCNVRKVEKSVLRDRALTGKCEKEVILTNKISHIGFSVVLNPNLKILKIFSSRPPRAQKMVFQKTRPRASKGKIFRKKIVFRIPV